MDEHRIGAVGSIQITTPDGIILIARLPGIGTQVMMYEDPNANHVGYFGLRDKG